MRRILLATAVVPATLLLPGVAVAQPDAGPINGEATAQQEPPGNCAGAPETLTFPATVRVIDGQLSIESPGGVATGPIDDDGTAGLTGPGETYELRSAEPADAPTVLMLDETSRGCSFRTTMILESALPALVTDEGDTGNGAGRAPDDVPDDEADDDSDDDATTFWKGMLIGGGALALVGLILLLWRRQGITGTDDDGIGPPPKQEDVKADTAKKRAEALAGVLDKIKDVNPLGGVINCAFCALCSESCFAGKPASAAKEPPHPAPVSWFREIAKTRWGTVPGVYTSQSDGTAAMANMGPGNRAILLLTRPDGTGHAINVLNVDGFVFFVDGQSGTEFTKWTVQDTPDDPPRPIYSTFHLIRTTK